MRPPQGVQKIGTPAWIPDTLPYRVRDSSSRRLIHMRPFGKKFYRGEMSARTLLRLLDKKDGGPRRVILPTELIIRQSTVGGVHLNG